LPEREELGALESWGRIVVESMGGYERCLVESSPKRAQESLQLTSARGGVMGQRRPRLASLVGRLEAAGGEAGWATVPGQRSQLSADPLGGASGRDSELNGGSSLRRIALVTAIILGLVGLYAVAHLALIELGREVVVLHKWTSDRTTRPTRLWIVDDDPASAWFHHGYSKSPWIQRLEQDPIVKVERAGVTGTYHATPDPGSHERVHQLLREKYGVADWWVRLITGTTENCPALPVRLERIDR
jgi:hypothetical protein